MWLNGVVGADDQQREVQERGAPSDRRQQRAQEHLQLLLAWLDVHREPRALLLQRLRPTTLQASAILRVHHRIHEGASRRRQICG